MELVSSFSFKFSLRRYIQLLTGAKNIKLKPTAGPGALQPP